MKIIEIILARRAVASMYSEKIPFALAYKFTKFLKETEAEGEFHKEKFQCIVNDYGEKDEKGNLVLAGNGFKVKDGETEKCFAAIKELDSTDVETPKTTFSLNDFNDIKLSTEAMSALFAFIEEK